MSQQKKTQCEPITRKQIALIHIAKADLGLDDDTYRDMLHGMFGAESSKDLSAAQADQLLDEFKARGFRIVSRHPRPPRRPKGKNVVNLASAGELGKIDALARLIDWQYQDGLQRLLERRFGIKSGKVRTSAEAFRVIEGLKSLFEGQMKRAHGEGWWGMRFDDPAVMEYIERHRPAEWK